MTNADLSGDGIPTPMVLLVISGDASTFKWVRDALDETDDGMALPVLVVADTGSAAEDIWTYVMGPELQWEADEKEREAFLPKISSGAASAGGTAGAAGGGAGAGAGAFEGFTDHERDEEYVEAARKYLPEIVKLGAGTGKNDKKQLAFYKVAASPHTLAHIARSASWGR